MESVIKNRYLILRRISQLTILFLYFGANAWGWKILVGNLSLSKIFGKIPLTDPYAFLQMLFAGAVISTDMIVGVIIIAVFYTLIGGRAFCSWVCPVNMITDLAAWLRRKTHHEKDNLISAMKIKNFRYWFAGILLNNFSYKRRSRI